MDYISRLAQIEERLAVARAQVEALTLERFHVVTAARRDGMLLRQIAEPLGLSVEGVQKLLERGERLYGSAA